jgi:hypothetical protein
MLIMTPTFANCLLSGVATTVTPETECLFTINSAGEYKDNLAVCKITITAGSCTVTVSPQVRPGLELATAIGPDGGYVSAKANVTGMAYQVAGTGCPKAKAPGSYSDGKYQGGFTLKA